jgi:hypothetical protein
MRCLLHTKSDRVPFVQPMVAAFGLVCEFAAELDPTLDGQQPDDAYRTVLVLVSALACGPDTQRRAEVTELPVEFVGAILRRMIAPELWTEIAVVCDHWVVGANLLNTTALWPDVLIGQGLAVRTWDERAGVYRYWLAEYAQAPDTAQRGN